MRSVCSRQIYSQGENIDGQQIFEDAGGKTNHGMCYKYISPPVCKIFFFSRTTDIDLQKVAQNSFVQLWINNILNESFVLIVRIKRHHGGNRAPYAYGTYD